MTNASKTYVLALIVALTVSCLIIVNPSFASMPKPSVPDFSVKYSNSALQVVIKNQLSYSNNETYHLYYNIRINSQELYPLQSGNGGPYGPYSVKYINNPQDTVQSNSENTIISIPFTSGGLLSNGQNSFQVEAIIGHDSQIWISEHALYPSIGGYAENAVAYDETSGWSNTITYNFDGSTLSIQPSYQESSPLPSFQPSNSNHNLPENSPEQDFDFMRYGLFIALCVIAVLLVVIALMYRKQIKNKQTELS